MGGRVVSPCDCWIDWACGRVRVRYEVVYGWDINAWQWFFLLRAAWRWLETDTRIQFSLCFSSNLFFFPLLGSSQFFPNPPSDLLLFWIRSWEEHNRAVVAWRSRERDMCVPEREGRWNFSLFLLNRFQGGTTPYSDNAQWAWEDQRAMRIVAFVRKDRRKWEIWIDQKKAAPLAALRGPSQTYISVFIKFFFEASAYKILLWARSNLIWVIKCMCVRCGAWNMSMDRACICSKKTYIWQSS